jgi:hypothetical protein
MFLHDWQQWLRQQFPRARRSGPGGADARRWQAWTRQPRLQRLEDRTLFAANPFADISKYLCGTQDTQGALPALQRNVDNLLGNLRQVPFVGNEVSKLDGVVNFVDKFEAKLSQALTTLGGIQLPDDHASQAQIIQTNIFQQLGPPNLNLIASRDGTTPAPKDVLVTFDPTLGPEGMVIEMTLSQAATLSTPVDFSTALPGLPIKVRTTGGVNVSGGYQVELAFQWNDNQQALSLLNKALPNSTHALVLTANAGLSTGFSAEADVGFLHGTLTPAKDTQGNLLPNNLGLTFGIDSLTSPSAPSLQGSADINLHAQGGFGPTVSVGDALGARGANQFVFPSVGVDFNAHWGFGPNAGKPSVGFKNVTFDLGQFVDGFLRPILTDLQTVTAPLDPIFKAITAPIPGLSDASHLLHGGDISLLTLADVAAPFFGFGPEADLVTQIVDLVNQINSIQVDSLGGISIPFGDFTVDSDVSNGDFPDISALTDLSNLPQLAYTALGTLGDTIAGLNIPPAIKDTLSSILKNPGGGKLDLEFPILNNPQSVIYGLLLGKDNPLVFLKGSMDFGADSGRIPSGLSLFGVELTGHATAEVKGQLELGYDTYGLRELLGQLTSGQLHASDVLSDLADGFYLKDDSGFQISGDVGVGVGARAGLAYANIDGGIHTGIVNGQFAPVSVGIIPGTAQDGKVRIHDFTKNVFTASGELDAGLTAEVGIGDYVLGHFVGVRHVFDIDSYKLIDFTNGLTPPPPPILASQPQFNNFLGRDGVVTLYMGPDAHNRSGVGNNTDGNETFTVTHVGGTVGDESILVSAFGYKQQINHVKAIIGVGGLGANKITVESDVLSDAYLYGDNDPSLPGDDGFVSADLTYLGSGTGYLYAAHQGSTLTGGPGSTVFTGYEGDDEIVLGSGSSTIVSLGAGHNSVVMSNDVLSGFLFVDAGNSPGYNTLAIEGTKGNSIFIDKGALSIYDSTNSSALVPIYHGFNQITITGSNVSSVVVKDLSGNGVDSVDLFVGYKVGTPVVAPHSITLNGCNQDDDFYLTAEERQGADGHYYSVLSSEDDRNHNSSELLVKFWGLGPQDTVVLDGGNGPNRYFDTRDFASGYAYNVKIQNSGTSVGPSSLDMDFQKYYPALGGSYTNTVVEGEFSLTDTISFLGLSFASTVTWDSSVGSIEFDGPVAGPVDYTFNGESLQETSTTYFGAGPTSITVNQSTLNPFASSYGTLSIYRNTNPGIDTSGSVTLDLESTRGTLNYDAHGGRTHVFAGRTSHTAQNLGADTSLRNTGGSFADFEIDDSADPSDRQVTLDQAISGLIHGAAPLTLYGQLDSFILDASAGSTVDFDHSYGHAITLNMLGGQVRVHSLDSDRTLTVNGRGQSATDFSSTDFAALAGPILVEGNAHMTLDARDANQPASNEIVLQDNSIFYQFDAGAVVGSLLGFTPFLLPSGVFLYLPLPGNIHYPIYGLTPGGIFCTPGIDIDLSQSLSGIYNGNRTITVVGTPGKLDIHGGGKTTVYSTATVGGTISVTSPNPGAFESRPQLVLDASHDANTRAIALDAETAVQFQGGPPVETGWVLVSGFLGTGGVIRSGNVDVGIQGGSDSHDSITVNDSQGLLSIHAPGGTVTVNKARGPVDVAARDHVVLGNYNLDTLYYPVQVIGLPYPVGNADVYLADLQIHDENSRTDRNVTFDRPPAAIDPGAGTLPWREIGGYTSPILYLANTLGTLELYLGGSGQTVATVNDAGAVDATLNLGSGGSVNIAGTSAPVHVIGADHVRIGTGTLSAIQGPVSVGGDQKLGFGISLAIDNSADQSTHNVTIAPQPVFDPLSLAPGDVTIRGLAPADITFSRAATNSVAVKAGMGDETYTLVDSPQLISPLPGVPFPPGPYLADLSLSLTSSAGPKKLVAPNQDNHWSIDGYGQGILDDTIHFSGFTSVVGGSGVDSFDLDSSTADIVDPNNPGQHIQVPVSGFVDYIDGGGGNNSLRFFGATRVSLKNEAGASVSGLYTGTRYDAVHQTLNPLSGDFNSFNEFEVPFNSGSTLDTGTDGFGSLVGAGVVDLVQDFAASVTATGFDDANLHFLGGFSGQLLAPSLSATQVTIDGSMTAGSILQLNSLGQLSVGVPVLDPNGFLNPAADLAGTVEVFPTYRAAVTMTSLSIGRSFMDTASITAPRIDNVAIGKDLAGYFLETDPTAHTQSFVVSGSVTTAGSVQVAAIDQLTIHGDQGGIVIVSGRLGSAQIDHDLTNDLSAGSAPSVTIGHDLTGDLGDNQLDNVKVGNDLSGTIRAIGDLPSYTDLALGTLTVTHNVIGQIVAPTVGTITIHGDLTGTVGDDTFKDVIDTLGIDGSIVAGANVKVNALRQLTVGGDLAGAVQATRTPDIGLALSSVTVTGNLSGHISAPDMTVVVHGDLTGVVGKVNPQDPLPGASVTVDGMISTTGVIEADGLQLTVGTDLAGTVGAVQVLSAIIGHDLTGAFHFMGGTYINVKHDLSGSLIGQGGLLGGSLGTLEVNNDVSGQVTVGDVSSLTVDGSVTSSAVVNANSIGTMTTGMDLNGTMNVRLDIATMTIDGQMGDTAVLKADSIGTLTVFGSLQGTVKAFGQFFFPANPSDPTDAVVGTVHVYGDLAETGSITAPTIGVVTVESDVAGAIRETNPTEDMDQLNIGGSLTGVIEAASIGTLTIGFDLIGQVTLTGLLDRVTVNGVLSGTVMAASIGSATVNSAAIAEYHDATAPGGTAFTFFPGPGSHTFQAGAFALLGSDQTVNLTGTDFVVSDGTSTADTTYTVTATTVQINNQPPISYAGASSLTIKGSRGTDIFNVESTAAAVPITLAAGAGSNTVNMSPTAHDLSTLGSGVTVAGNGGLTTLVVNDQAHADPGLYTVTDSTVGRPGAAITYHGVAQLTLNGGSAAVDWNFLNISSTPAGMATTINAGANYQVQVGGGTGRLDGVLGPVTVNGVSNDALNIVDFYGTTGAAYSLTYDAASRRSLVARTGLPNINFTNIIFAVQILAGSGDDTFNIEGSDPNTNELEIWGGGGNNSFNLSPTAHNLAGVRGAIAIEGTGPGATGGSAVLTINDQADTLDRGWRLTHGGVTLLSVVGIGYDAVNQVIVNAGSGDNSFGVEGLTATIPVRLNAGTATTTINVGTPGNTIDPVAGHLTINGAGITNVNFNEQGADPSVSHGDNWYDNHVDFAYTNHALNLQVDFTGVAQMTVSDPGATTNGHLFYAMPAVGGLTINGAGNDILTAVAPAVGQNDWWITGHNAGNLNHVVQFNNIYFLQTAYSGTDVFHLMAGGSETFIGVPGQGETAVLDLSGYTPGAVVTLPTSTAAGSVGADTRFNGMQWIIGTAGNDTLVGPDMATAWDITGTNAGVVHGAAFYQQVFLADVAFSGFENLRGGAGADTFKLQAGGSVSGTIDGGGGSDSYVVPFGALAVPLTIADSGTTGTDSLTAQAATGTNYITKTATQVTWGNPVQETVNYSGIENLTVDGRAGTNNTIIDPGSPNTTIMGGPGINNITIANTGAAGVVFQDGGGTNNITVVMGNLLGPVTLNGTTGTTQVTVKAPAGANVLTLTGTQLTGAGQTINFNLGTTLSKLSIDGSTGNDQLVVVGNPPAPLTLENVIVATTTTLTSSVNPSVYGQAVTFTATVTGNVAGAGAPDGTVDFMDTTTGIDLGTASLMIVNGVSQATLTTTMLAAGANSLTANYGGSRNFLASQGSLSQSVASIVIMNPTATGALNVSGNGTINVPGIIIVDSSSTTALTVGDNTAVTGSSIQVVGGVKVSGNAHLSPQPMTLKTAVADPLASLPVPSGGTSYAAVNLAGNSTLTICPGVYPAISVSGNASLTLNPGIYVIAGGGFSVSGKATVSGNGVLICNAGSNYPSAGGTFGSITFGGNANVNLSAPANGAYAGVLIFQTRDNTRPLTLGSNAVQQLNGTGHGGIIYAPSAALGLGGNAGSADLALVVGSLSLSGNAGAFQLVDGASSAYLSSTNNWIFNPVLTVAVQDDTGTGIDAGEMDRINEAMAYLNAALGSFGVSLSWAAAGTNADVHIHFASSTPQGGAGAGVLGFTTAGNDVYIVTTGWNFYTGADASQLGSAQYDFLTLATHELAHTVGLGESSDPASVMYEYLTPGTVRRTFTDNNLTLINTDSDRFMKVGGGSVQGIQSDNRLATVFRDGTYAGATAGTLGTFRANLLTDLPGSQAAPFLPGPKGADGLWQKAPAQGSLDVLVGGDGNDLRIGSSGKDVLVGGFGHDGGTGDTKASDQGMSTEALDLYFGTAAADYSITPIAPWASASTAR